MRYVIVGGGIAGTTAAEALRKMDPDAEVVLICSEQHRLYSRVLLTPYLVGKVERERVFLKKEHWYHENNIEWMPGIFVTGLNPKNKFVTLSDGRELEYDKLLLCTGAEARPAPWDMRGVAYFRNLDDTDHMLQLMNEQRSDSRVCIYGGGFIACDLLQIFKKHGLNTTIIFRGTYFWSRVLSEEAGLLINQHIESNGVKVVTSTTIEGVVGERELEKIKTTAGEIDCSLLAVGIGLEMDFSWIEKAGVEVGKGIKCNEFLETNVADIYTAGDVAEFYDVIVERSINIGTWLNAMMQGRVVAKNMAGEKKAFELVSSYATNILDLEVIFIGDTVPEASDKIEVIGSAKEGGVTQLFIREGRLVGGITVGRNTDRPIITRMIKEKQGIVATLDKLEY